MVLDFRSYSVAKAISGSLKTTRHTVEIHRHYLTLRVPREHVEEVQACVSHVFPDLVIHVESLHWWSRPQCCYDL